MNRMQAILSNKHTSASAVISFLCLVGTIWLPQYKEQFHQTMEAALSYGLLMAGDAPRAQAGKDEAQKQETQNESKQA